MLLQLSPIVHRISYCECSGSRWKPDDVVSLSLTYLVSHSLRIPGCFWSRFPGSSCVAPHNFHLEFSDAMLRSMLSSGSLSLMALFGEFFLGSLPPPLHENLRPEKSGVISARTIGKPSIEFVVSVLHLACMRSTLDPYLDKLALLAGRLFPVGGCPMEVTIPAPFSGESHSPARSAPPCTQSRALSSTMHTTLQLPACKLHASDPESFQHSELNHTYHRRKFQHMRCHHALDPENVQRYWFHDAWQSYDFQRLEHPKFQPNPQCRKSENLWKSQVVLSASQCIHT